MYVLASRCPFWGNKLSIRFHHILPGQLHQENDSGHGINYACPWPKTRGVGGAPIHTDTHTLQGTCEEEKERCGISSSY